MSVRENVRLPLIYSKYARQTEDRVLSRQVLADVGLADKIDVKPHELGQAASANG